MNSDCLQGDPIQHYQIFLGLLAFAIFFAIVISCQTSGAKHNKNKQKQIEKVWKKAPSKQQIEYNQQFSRTAQNLQANPIIQSDTQLKNIHTQKDQKVGRKILKYQELQTKINQINKIKDQGPKIFMKQKDVKKTLKNLVDYAYHYPQKEYQMLNIFRSEQEIIKEREAFVRREMPKDQVNPINNETTNINNMYFKKQSNFKRTQSVYKPLSQKNQKQIVQIDKKTSVVTPNKPLVSNFQNNVIKKIDLPNKQTQNKETIFGQKTNQPFFRTTNNISNTINKTNFTSQPPKAQLSSTNLLQKKVQQPKQNNTQKKQEKPTIPIMPILKAKQVQNKIQKKQQPIIQKQPLIKQKQVQKQTDKRTLKQTIKQENNKQAVNQIKKITNSSEYLDAIVKYSEKFVQKTQIATKIGNLDGARSDPKDLWEFTTNYITTIDAKNNDELVTFTYKIWQAIVHKFMKNTNIKDGFQKIPPKEKNKQVYKNQINTYVLFVTIYRTLGYEQIWLGVFGKTLKMLNFLLKRKQAVKSWKKLDLLQNNYINKEGNIGQKYLTRIDFLTYFLLALTTFDPIEAFQEVAEKTGENYPFLNELKKTKYKWSYKQFWCLVQSMRKNPFQGYFKIPFWNNALSVIYLPIMKSLKQGHMKEFVVLSKWIFKECKELTKKIDKAEQSKLLIDQIESEFQFDGEQFIDSVKSLGKAMQTTREKQMKITKWEDFRDKCSTFYFFWRISS